MLGGEVPVVPERVGVNATSQSPKGKALGVEQQGRGQGYTRYVPYIEKKTPKKNKHVRHKAKTWRETGRFSGFFRRIR